MPLLQNVRLQQSTLKPKAGYQRASGNSKHIFFCSKPAHAGRNIKKTVRVREREAWHMNRLNISYLPLGDSYTIGEGAEPHESFPMVLSSLMNAHGFHVSVIANPARTGWTTQDLITHELPIFESMNPQISTLLIGVNDWVQGFSCSAFSANLQRIIQRMMKKLGGPHLVLLTIPDFSVTPEGPKYSKGRDIPTGLQEFNAVIREMAFSFKLPVVNLFEPSQKMKTDPSLIAKDSLHPSAKAYRQWAELTAPAFLSRLQSYLCN